jgi:aspartate aminotransferase
MARIGESGTFRVTRLARELAAKGVEVVDLGVGEPDQASPQVAVAAAQEALARGFTKYTDPAGTRELRDGVAAYLAERYGAPWSGGQGLITIGAKMALFDLAEALFAEGDEVIIPSPCWVSFPEQVRFVGAEPVLVPTSGADCFRIHAEPILSAMTERTRGVIVNTPSNPTGGVIGAGDLRRLVEACAARGIPLISDETYDRFLFDGAAHASAGSLAAEFPDTVVLVGSFSKTYSMTGWRLGYAFGPAELIGALLVLQGHTTSNATSFAMKGALAALAAADGYVDSMMAEYQARRELLVAGLAAIPGIVCRPPSGAFYAFPDVSGCFRPGRQGSVAFAEYLLTEAAVAVVPGLAFGSDDHVRVSFACSRETLGKGLDRMARALRA